jgi:HSP20 family protein
MSTLVRETRETDRTQAEQFVASPASLSEETDGYTLEIEMPGVNVEGTLIHHESRPENFRRTFELDPSIDADEISAKIDQGLVTLTLPKTEHVKPRKIAVS